MNHEAFKELCALRLYGEADDAERASLDAHLATCASCRAFDAELQRGLGALSPAPRASELPPGWDERLRRATRVRRARVPAFVAAAAAAGFLIGSLFGSGTTVAPPAPHTGGVAALESSFRRFEGERPPPTATGSGQLARLGTYLAR